MSVAQNNTSKKDTSQGTPVIISEEELAKLKVAEIKTELSRRCVDFPSTYRKQQLLSLLKQSLHLPVVANDSDSGKPQEKNGVTSAKKKTKKHMKWDQHHPAQNLLFCEIAAGNIPLDKSVMGPAEVYYTYSGTLEFQMEGMAYGKTFVRRLRDLRKQVKKDRKRATKDKDALVLAFKNHPPPALNRRGKPQWNGSVAQALLKYDIAQGKHLGKKPTEFRNERREYMNALSVDDFRWKLHQEIRTQKYLFTLEHEAGLKLKSVLKKGVGS